MSASAKLRALDAAAKPAPWRYVTAYGIHSPVGVVVDPPAWSPEDAQLIATLRTALPLIADVVEAAEKYLAQLDADQERSGAAIQDHMLPYRQREYAMRGCLTALREHLEGGDVT